MSNLKLTLNYVYYTDFYIQAAVIWKSKEFLLDESTGHTPDMSNCNIGAGLLQVWHFPRQSSNALS